MTPIRSQSRLQALGLRLRTAVAVGVLLLALLAVAGLLRVDAAVPRPRATRASLEATDSVIIYGPQQFTKYGTPTQWTIYDDVFEADTLAGWRYEVHVVNSQITQGTIAVGERQFVGTSELGLTVGSLIRRIDVAEGSNSIDIALKGTSGASLTVKVVRKRDPQFRVFGPQEHVRPTPIAAQTDSFTLPADATTPHTLWVLNGSPNGANRITNATLHLNGAPILSASDFGSGKATITRDVSLQSGLNRDSLFNQSASGTLLTLSYFATDSTAPEIALAAPFDTTDTLLTRASVVHVSGTVTDEIAGLLKVSAGVSLLTPGAFADSVMLPADGTYPITVYARNSAKLEAVVQRVVVRDTEPPWLSIEGVDSVTTDTTVTLTVRWWDTTLTTVTCDGVPVGIARADSAELEYALDVGPNRIFARAIDRMGDTTEVTRFVLRKLPGDAPSTNPPAASSPPTTGFNSFLDNVSFLYSGAGAVQTDVQATSIDPARAAVLRGCVTARDFGGVPNVIIRVLGHPEFGQTLTRADGMFDLVVNGDAELTLRFSKLGYLEAHRQISPPANDYTLVDTVALIGRSARRTFVRLADEQVVRGRFATDANGDRDIRLFFFGDNRAHVTNPETGADNALDSVHVRATEYTIGSQGPQAMPALLPPSSAYTYCVELTLDEADDIANRTGRPVEVRFEDALSCYVRNFLRLPVGTHVPYGYYDRTKGMWIPREDGIILKIIGADGELAMVDVDGDAQPDTARLVDLGITAQERRMLLSEFQVGDEVWRIRIDHFSAPDFNWNLAAMLDALKNAGRSAFQLLKLLVGGCFTKSGSIIDCENRVLGEQIPVIGTPYTLNYRSYRAPGDAAMRTVRVPITNSDAIPEDLDRITVVLEVAGTRKQVEYPRSQLSPDQVVPMLWDGLDVYGRRVLGSMTARVSVGYRYKVSYALGGSGSFGNPSRNSTGFLVTSGERRQDRTTWSRSSVRLGAPGTGAAGLGGWTLDVHHYFDPNGAGAVYYGDGSILPGEMIVPSVWQWASDYDNTINRCAGYTTDPDGELLGTHAIGARILRHGPDGLLYIADNCHNAILRVGGDRIMHRVVGKANGGTSRHYGTDGPALTTQLGTISDFLVGPDGVIYIALGPDRRILRAVVGDSVKTVIAGTNPCNLGLGENVPVAQAELAEPRSLALGPDGSLFIGEQGSNPPCDGSAYRVRRISPNGIISTYAGEYQNPCQNPPLTGVAKEICLRGVDDLEITPDGMLFILEGGQGRVRKVAPDGVMRTLFDFSEVLGIGFTPERMALAPDGSIYLTNTTGTPQADGVLRWEPDGYLTYVAGGTNALGGDGAPATARGVGQPHDILLEADGSFLVTDAASALNWVGRVFGMGDAGEYRIPSPDGAELHYFDLRGRHLRTRDAMTGAVRFRFDYSGSDTLLWRVHDVDGGVTTIRRNPDGTPYEIEGPYGQITTVATGTSSSGAWLASVASPAGDSTLFTYRDGLLRTFTNPRGLQSEFEYGEDGRLSWDEDPLGNRQDVVQDSLVNGRRVASHYSAMDRHTEYRTVVRGNGTAFRESTGPDGLKTVTEQLANLSTVTTLPGGTVLVDSIGPEPRAGMVAPLDLNSRVVLPSGLKRSVMRTYPYGTSTFDPLAHTGTWQREVRINGRSSPWVTTYSAPSRTLTVTSPVGRQMTAELDTAGRVLSETLPGMAATWMEYDTQGRLTALRQQEREWSFSYDALGRLVSVRDPLEKVDSLGYDAANRLIRQRMSDGRLLLFNHDQNGNLTGIQPPGRSEHHFDYTEHDLNDAYSAPAVPGVTSPALRFEYDGDRALTKIVEAGEDSIEFDYDPSTGRLESLAHGRGTTDLTYSTSSGLPQTLTSPDTVTLSFAYDGPLLKRQEWSGRMPGGATASVEVDFDGDFRPLRQRVNDGHEVAFGYDDDGLLTSAGALSVHRTLAGGLVDSTTAGLVRSSIDYDPSGAIANLRYSYDGSTLFFQSLRRDALGRITEVAETAFGTSHTTKYRYDEAGRLYGVVVGGDTTARYWYDANGNRIEYRGATAADTATGTYDGQDRILRWKDTRYEFTDAGRLRRKIVPATGGEQMQGGIPFVDADTTLYTYDAVGSLVEVVLPGRDTIRYMMDGTGRRIGRKLNGQWTGGWVYQSKLDIVAELDSAGAVRNRYVYGANGTTPSLVVRDDATYRLIVDQLGSVRGAVDVASGAVRQQRDFDAWGEESAGSGSDFHALGFAGGLEDARGALVRFGARDYDSEIGRWTARDPIGFAGRSANGYSYCKGDPINMADVNGLTSGYPCMTLLKHFVRLLVLRDIAEEEAEEIADQTSEHDERKDPMAQNFAFDVNAYRHLRATQLVADEYGPVVALAAGVAQEVARPPYTDGRTRRDTATDLVNDLRGLLPSNPTRHLPNDFLRRYRESMR